MAAAADVAAAAGAGAGASHRRIRTELRERMRRQGATGRQIAEAMMAEFRVSPLLAYRWAHDLSQKQACAAYNALDPSGSCGLEAGRLSNWENWPHSDRRPPAHALRRFAEIYRTSSNLLLPVEADYSHLDVPGISAEVAEAPHTTPETQESPFRYAHDDDWADGWPCFGDGRPDVKRQQFLDWTKWASLGAVLESLSLTRDAEGPGGGPATHAQLDLAVRHFGEIYENTPRDVMFAAVRRCRKIAAELRGYPQSGEGRRHLLMVSGWLSSLLAVLEFDRDDFTAARSHNLAAWQVGQHLADVELSAWVRANQSMIEFYAGDYTTSLGFASSGLALASPGTIRVRLLVEGQGRALARLNRPAEARQVLAAGAREIDEAMRGEQQPSLFAFGEAALEKCAGTTLLWLGEPKQALVHTRHALALHGPTSESSMMMNPMTARFDETHAWVQLGHPDRAAQLGSRLLEASKSAKSEERWTIPLRKARQLQELLAPHAALAEVRDYTEQLHSLTQHSGLALQA